MILLLLGSSALSILIRQYDDALSIGMAMLIVSTVAFVQEYQSEKSLEALKTLVPPRCNVIRSGQTMNILAEQVRLCTIACICHIGCYNTPTFV